MDASLFFWVHSMSANGDGLADVLAGLIKDSDNGLSESAARSALQGPERTVFSQDEFDRLVLDLQRRQVIRLRHDKKGRTLYPFEQADTPLPGKIEREKDLEPHMEGYLWRQFHEKFLNSEPQHYSLVVQNTARGGTANGLWRRPDLTAAVVTQYKYSRVPQLV